MSVATGDSHPSISASVHWSGQIVKSPGLVLDLRAARGPGCCRCCHLWCLHHQCLRDRYGAIVLVLVLAGRNGVNPDNMCLGIAETGFLGFKRPDTSQW